MHATILVLGEDNSVVGESKSRTGLDLTNTGQRQGDETVQLYIRDDVSSVITYEKQLRGFQRVSLMPGQTKRITFHIQARDLAILDRSYRQVAEPGTFTAMVGSSSEDIRLKGSFELIQRQ